MSVNFKALQACDPKLAQADLSFEVRLNRLKEVIDQNYTTLSQRTLEREVYLRAQDQSEKRLKIIGFQNSKSQKWETSLSVYRVNKTGEFELLPQQPKVRKNPKMSDLKGLFLNHQVLSDRTQFEDFKVNSVRMLWTRVGEETLELRLLGLKSKQTLACQKQSDGLVICTCTAG